MIAAPVNNDQPAILLTDRKGRAWLPCCARWAAVSPGPGAMTCDHISDHVSRRYTIQEQLAVCGQQHQEVTYG